MKLLSFVAALLLDTAVAVPALASARDDPFAAWSPPGAGDGDHLLNILCTIAKADVDSPRTLPYAEYPG